MSGTSSRRFRHATMQDYAQIERNYARAREFMKKTGNPTQWADKFPLPAVTQQDIQERRMMLYVDTVDGEERILAQFAVCHGIDPTYIDIEGAWLDDDSYVTLHRVASSGLVKHAARDAIQWALQHYGNVRVDTHPNNKAMQHVLESCGFARCGLIQLLDRDTDTTRIAYQRHEW